jgi:hypothetical protein
MRENTELARRLGLIKTNVSTGMGMKDPRATFAAQNSSTGVKNYAVVGNGTASWYGTLDEANAYARQTGGVVKDLSKVAPVAPNPDIKPPTGGNPYAPTANFANQVKYNNITQPPAQSGAAAPVNTQQPRVDPRVYTPTGGTMYGNAPQQPAVRQNPYAQVTQQMNPLDALLMQQVMAARAQQQQQQAPQPSWVTGVGNWR